MAERERSLRWRPKLRALHRDIGYLAVGLTIVYAVSGLAVNHILDWNPNFVEYEQSVALQAELPDDEGAAVKQVMSQLELEGEASGVFRAGPELEFSVERNHVVVDEASMSVLTRGERPRFFVRMANWLHLQRGKKAWNYFADAYAIFLLFLAASGLFMLPGKKGLKGRGGILVGAGILAPAIYVVASGGPSGSVEEEKATTAVPEASGPAPMRGAPPPPEATGAPPPPPEATGAPPPPATGAPPPPESSERGETG